MLHCLVSGRTGSGKSCLGRVLVEGLVVYEDLAILILDPRGQWAGLLWPEDRSEVLARYGSFGLEPGQARSFPFTYHGVGLNLGEPLPEDLKQLALGRRIVSFKGMDDRARCELFARILEEAFEANATAESGRPGLLVVVEEITLFLKKGVMDEAQEAAQHAELSVDRIAREGRKYGVNLLLPGQSSKDLSYAMASTRQNITTRVFMGNSNREIEYADEFLSRMIVSLPPGEVFVCNPEWGVVRIRVRPSLSKVHEPGEQEIRRVVGLPDPGRPPTAIRCRAGGA
jgi:DNA helicase HerA-like ATPase